MTARHVLFGAVLAALLPMAGSVPAHSLRALAPIELVADAFDDPRGLVVDPGEVVFVADRARGIVVRLGPDGTDTVVARRLRQPFGVGIDGERRVLVTEESAGRLLRLDVAGPREIAANLPRPRWIAVAADDTAYVVVRSAARDDDDLDAIVAVAPDGRVRLFADRLPDVAGIAVDTGALYVALRAGGGYSGVRRIAIGADGAPGAAVWVGPRDVLRRAGGLARDRLGALWVSGDGELREGRIRDAVLKIDGDDVRPFAQGFDDPRALALGPHGDLYVADARSGRIVRFRAPAPPALDPIPEAVASTTLSVRGTGTSHSRVDLFVDTTALAVRATTDAAGRFSVDAAIAENVESRLEVSVTAADGTGLTSAPTLVSTIHDGHPPDLAVVRPSAGAFVRGRVDVEIDARDGGTGVAQASVVAATRSLALTASPPLPTDATRLLGAWDTGGAADGAVTLVARAVDRAGNERTATRVALVDNTPPEVEIVEGPAGEITDASPAFRFAGRDNLTPATSLAFAWRVDGGDFTAFAASTSATLLALAPGLHRFEVKARDLAGNESMMPAARSFTLSPGPTITAVVPAAASVGSQVTVLGDRFAPGPLAVAFNGVPATARRVTSSSLLTSVPPGATSGPLTVDTERGTAAHAFEVEQRQALVLEVSPRALQTVAGLPVTATVRLDDTGVAPFTGLATVRVVRAPDGIATSLGAPALAAGATTTLAIAPEVAGAASGTIVVEATAALADGIVRRTVELSLSVLAGHATALGGRLLLVDGTPIAAARLSLGDARVETDAGGHFLFVDPPAGRHMLGVDASAARAGLPIYAIDVDVAGDRPTALPPFRITPPPPAERFVAIDNAVADQVVTDPRFPGFSLTLPAGVTIVGWDGTPKQRIAIDRLEPDALPVPPPPFPTRSLYQVFFGTPMGGLPSRALPISLPNDQDLAPGETVEIWYYDAAPIPGVTAGWRHAGDATVSADGTRAVSNPGVGLARFCGVCGVACIKRKAAGQPNRELHGVRAGDPVDLATGLLIVEKTDLVLPGRIAAFAHRVYNALDPFGRVAGFELPTGPGWTLSTDVALLDDGGDARLLIMPGNARVSLARVGDGVYANDTSAPLAGAVLHAEGSGQHRLVFKDGGSWRFRGGWRARGRLGLLTGLGLLIEQRDRHGSVQTIDRDAFGAVTSVSEPSGRTLTFTTALLDGADPTSARLVSVLDPLGRTVRYGYDATRRLTTVTDAAGGVVRYSYDAAGRLATATDPRGITYLAAEYDDAGRVVRQLQADGGEWRFAYEGPAGAHTGARVVDPRGAVTTYRFVAGRAVLVVDALGQATRLTRDVAGRVTSATDALGRTVGLDHDAGGNLVRVTDPLGHRREMTYDATGRVRTATDALGGVARLEYDAGGRLQAAVDAAGTRLRFDVDASGRPVSMTDAAGGTTRLEYAATGEVVAVVDPLGRRTSFEYDAASRLVRRRDALGGLVTLAYDALDRIVQLTDATGTVRYDYDANGNLVAVTDPLGRRVQYEYDAMDRRVARTDAVGVTTRFTYDAMGNLVAAVDGQGRTTVYEHDLLGRRVTIVDGHGARTELGYDASGRLLRATADGQTVLFEHDALGRVTAETTMLGTTRYTWDAGGRRATMTRPDGTVVGYSHDAAARPTGITRGRDSVALVYDDAGRRRRLSLPGGIEVEYAHDVGSRLVAITYRRGPTVLGTLSHAYDELDRRITVSGSLADVALPRPLADAAYDDANRPLHVGEHRLAHDAAGNVTRWTSPDGDWIFSWDARGRLTAASGPNERLTFAYDALGRRTAVERDGRLTAFGYDGGDVVEDVAADGERRYLRGLGVDELFAVDDAAALTDGLGSLLRMIDADGRVRDAVAYEPFGRTTSGAVGTRYGFTGRERDTSDLYHYRARYYHAGLGRFLSEDPLGLTAGINAYVYAFNDPVNLVDPSGLRTYVLHGIWPDRAAFDQFAGALREADPATTTLRWNGSLLGGVVPSTRSVAADLVPQILADLDADPLAAGEKLNLIGFSGGGLVAASLAEMLRARGVKVDTVVTMGTPAHTPITARVPSETRLMNFIGAFDPLVSFRLHPRGTNHLVLATHTARSYTENARVLALVKREIAR